jgi:integrase
VPEGALPVAAALIGMTVAPGRPERARSGTALYTGMPKGQLFALQKADVDFDAGLILVSRSHNLPSGAPGPSRR